MTTSGTKGRGARGILGGGLLAAAAALALGGPAVAQEKVLRVGMTAADIPYAAGQPD